MDSDLPGLKDHGKHYPSSNHIDELAWGNLWMYFATGVSSPPPPFVVGCTLCYRDAQATVFRPINIDGGPYAASQEIQQEVMCGTG
jgi:hypothetical protein